VQREPSTVSYKTGGLSVIDLRNLAQPVDAGLNLVQDAARVDLDRSLFAAQDVGHGHQGLEGVSLRAATGGNVGFAAGDSNAVVQDIGDGIRGDAGAVVGDGDPRLIDLHSDGRGGSPILTGVNGVVHQFLDDDQRPHLRAVPDLGGKFLLAKEVHQSRGAERLAGDGCGSAALGDG
jgi:hypothetical protein